MVRVLAMTPRERWNLNWLDVITVDGWSLRHMARWFETPADLVVCNELIRGVTNQFQNVIDVLERLQRQTQQEGDSASELRGLLKDLADDGYRLHRFLEHFSNEGFLSQFIRSQKLMDSLKQASNGVDEFLYAIQRSRFGERFNELAGSACMHFSEEAWAEACQYDLLYARNAFMRRFDIVRDPVLCPLIDTKICPEDNKAITWPLAFEQQRLRRLGISNPFFDIAERELCVTNCEAKVAPWFIPSDEITIDEVIGKGGRSVVYLGMLSGAARVAVKRALKVGKTTPLRSISIWYQLAHPHILRFYGASFPDSECSVAFEYAQYGPLYRYLGASIDSNREQQLWRLFYEAALGLHYMHGQGFVHGDLKCNNILISEGLKAKLADFRLSFKKGDLTNVLCSEAVHWAAPECLDEKRQKERSFSTDVYMFGMCIVEALIGGPPYGGRLLDAAVRRLVKRGELPISIGTLAPQVQELVRAMCAFDPSARMELEDVIAKLKEFVDAADPSLLVVSE